MGLIVWPARITAGDIAGGALSVASGKVGKLIVTVPVPAGLTPAGQNMMLSGVSWTPMSNFRNLDRAFSWIRVRRAPQYLDKVLITAKSRKGDGSVAISVLAMVDKQGAGGQPANVNLAAKDAFTILTNPDNAALTWTLPNADAAAVGLEYYIRSKDTGNPNITVKTARVEDTIYFQFNDFAKRRRNVTEVNTIMTGEFVILACRQPGVWITESRTDGWRGKNP